MFDLLFICQGSLLRFRNIPGIFCNAVGCLADQAGHLAFLGFRCHLQTIQLRFLCLQSRLFLFDQLAVLFEFLQFLLVIGCDPFKKVRSIQQFIEALGIQQSVDVTGLIPLVHIPYPDHHTLILPCFRSFRLFQTGLSIRDLLLLVCDLLFQI